ncbi:MAG: endonuclease/exonuclease/phosphatase family protein [Acidobacteriota bacterium]
MDVKLRVMSANLMGARGADPEALVRILERERPDVLALQEVSNAQAERIAKSGLFPYGHMDQRRSSLGLGMLLRRPGSVRRLPLPRRDGWIAQVEVTEPETDRTAVLEVINVHLTPPHYLPPWKMLWQRRRQIHTLRSHLAANSRRPRVLLGDLNSTTLFPAYQALRAHLDDAALVAASLNGGITTPTWAPRPGWRPLLRIDHVLIDSSIEVEAFCVVPVPGSDHAAVRVDLRISAP